MKTILVPVEPHDASGRILALAAQLAGKLDAVVTGFALRRPQIAAIGWDPASVAIVTDPEWDDQRSETEARAQFERVMADAGLGEAVSVDTPAPAGARYRWHTEPASGDEFLGSFGRAFDLTVVGQPTSRSNGSSITSLEAALFDSGGPIMVAPSKPVDSFGASVGIVWNGSSETARTIAFSKPLIRKASRAIIFADDGEMGLRPGGEQIQRRLAENGVNAELKLLPDGKIRSGETLLAEAKAFGCDMLVKGAYTQSRLRQMIFGGATRYLIAESPVPVFMAH